MLKRINLSHSQNLLEVEELSEARNLEEIDLCGCKNLQSFPEFPSTVELKFEVSSIKTIFPPVTLFVKSLHEFLDNQRKPLLETPESHIFDFMKFRSFRSSQGRITNTDFVESPPTFKRMICQKALEMSRSLQRGLTNLNFEYDVFKIRPLENLMFTKLKEDTS